MLKNYFTIAVRNLFRYKGFSFINIAGLAIGIACTILILMWVDDELSYDQFHANADRVYRVNKEYQIGAEIGYNPSTPFPLAKAAKEYTADVEEAAKFCNMSSLFKFADKIFREYRICYTEPSFFNIFSFSFKSGGAGTALSDPNSVVISERMAEKYFGDNDPIGKNFLVNNRGEFSVSGVIENPPDNSEFNFDFFLPISFITDDDDSENWGSHWLSTYVLLGKNADYTAAEARLSALIKEHLPEEKISLKLQPLHNLHLYSIDGKAEGMKYVYFFSIVAFFILITACINFMNLSTARSSKRAKEVGLRKVVGATKMQIVKQFFGESVIISIIALLAALVLVELVRPAFNDLTGKNLTIALNNYKLLLSLLVIVVFTGIIAGGYPALFLSSFQPVKALQGNRTHLLRGSFFRRILVVIQFALSIILIIGTFVIYSQLRYIQKRDMGYDKENLLCLRLNRDLNANFEVMKNELLQISEIAGITRTSEAPNEIWTIMRGITWEGKETDEGAAFGCASVDFDYIETMGMEMAAGRSFSRDVVTDSMGIIFNEKAIEIMKMDSPVGKPFPLGEDDKSTIIGVVKNFHSLPLTYEVEPLMLIIDPSFYRMALLKTKSDDIANTLQSIETVWKKHSPDYPFEYQFLDERFDKMYRDEQRAGELFTVFVILAIFISSLGLFGLAAFTTEQKTKEIGIRKVLGATAANIVKMISKEFVILVIIASVIAWPIAWYAMNKWLQNFVYRTDINWWVYVFAGMAALTIALITISFQALRAAASDPIKSLRYE